MYLGDLKAVSAGLAQLPTGNILVPRGTLRGTVPLRSRRLLRPRLRQSRRLVVKNASLKLPKKILVTV